MTATAAQTAAPPVLSNNEQFVKVVDRVGQLKAAAERAVIDNAETLQQGADLNKLIAVALKKSEELRLGLVRPIKQAAENIDARFRPVKTDLQAAQRVIKGKMDRYLDEQERIAREAAAADRRAAEEQALRDAEAAEAAGQSEKADEILTQAAEVPAPEPTQTTNVVRGDLGGAYHRRTDYDFEVVDLSKIPPEHLQVNEKAVKDAIKAAKADGTIEKLEIPGLRIFEKKIGVTD